ncbi:MAG: DNA polymerase-3 subunit gamma/tau [Gammaproteobacteria bacterium]|jgi:DNA polymerase-3 subunit gamma/tau
MPDEAEVTQSSAGEHEPAIEPPVMESVATTKQQPLAKPIATDAIRWTELSYDLGLQGLAQEIATNSVVGKFEQNHLQLFLTRDFMEFVNPANQDEICQAIASKLGLSLILDLQIQDQLDAETPSETKTRKQQEHRQAAIESIKQEPTVKKLQRAFGAELIESSVRQIEKINSKEQISE